MKSRLLISAVALFTIVNTHAQTNRLASCIDYLSKNKKTPQEYILSKFSNHDIILLSEEHRVKENLELVQSLVPELYKKGIYTIGMEFGASEDQAALDSLITAKTYNEGIARKLMFHYNSGWAFKEYMDIYRKAWELNKSLPATAKKFRILNLSYHYNWANFSGARTPENMSQVFPKGNTESYRFKIVQKEIIDKKEKILILTGDIHAFTKYKYPVYDYLGKGFVRYEEKNFGNLLYAKYPEKVFSILLHKPFYNYINKLPLLVSPANGDMETIMEASNNIPTGFDLNNTPMGKLPDSSYYSMGYPNFVLEDMYDGYVFIKPIHQLNGCTIDPLFLTKENWQEAANTIPDPDWRSRPKNLEEYWEQILEYANVPKKYAAVNKQ